MFQGFFIHSSTDGHLGCLLEERLIYVTQEDPDLETNTWQAIPVKQLEHLPSYSDCESRTAHSDDEDDCDDAKIS